MKPILHEIEYELEDGGGQSVTQDISPAYEELLRNAGDVSDLLDDDHLITELSEVMCRNAVFEDENGDNWNWMAWGASLVTDLSGSLERDWEPDKDDIEAVRSLIADWLFAYSQGSVHQSYLEEMTQKAERAAKNIVSTHKLSDPKSQPILIDFLSELVLIEGFDECLEKAVARNSGNDPIRAMKIAQNIAEKFTVKP